MTKIYSFIILILFILSQNSVLAEELDWIQNPSNDHFYALTPTPMTWEESENYAQTLGGHLVTINSSEENQWIMEYLRDLWFGLIEVGDEGETFGDYGEYAWIGYSDLDNDGSYTWSSSEPNDFTNWRTGEPNNLGGNENVAAINGTESGIWNGKWDDISHTVNIYGIVEVEQIYTPTPTPTPIENINSYQNFPDPNFKRAIEEFMGVEAGGFITDQEAANMTGTLDISGKEISYVTGIEYFTNIEEFNFNNCNVKTANLSHNINLKNIRAQGNGLEQIDISNIENIDWLWLPHNKLSELNLSDLESINALNVVNNPISNIDVSRFSMLHYYHISDTKINELDISHIKNLRDFACTDLNIVELDVSKNTKLGRLDCSNNQLIDLNISANLDLNTLVAQNNNIKNIDLSENPNLKALDISNNLFDYNDWEFISEYKEKLGQPEYHDWGGLKSGFKYSPQKHFNPFEADLNLNSSIRYFGDSYFRQSIRNIFNLDSDDEFTPIDAINYQHDLDLSNQNIRTIEGLKYFLNVSSINLSNNNINNIQTFLNFDYPNLNTLDLRNNNLDHFDYLQLKDKFGDKVQFFPQNEDATKIQTYYNKANGHYYSLVDTSFTWEESREFIDKIFSEFAHLATITTEEENNFIKNSFGSSTVGKFLGGFQSDEFNEISEGDYSSGWQWVTGEEWNYAVWAFGQPDDFQQGEDYLQYDNNSSFLYQWNDIDSEHQNGFIVEWEEKPQIDIDIVNVDDTPSIGNTSIRVRKDEVVNVPIEIENLPLCTSFTLELMYDPNILEWQQEIIKKETLVSSWGLVDANIIENGRLRISGAAFNGDPASGNGNLVIVPFKISSNAESGSSIQIDFENLKDGLIGVSSMPITLNVLDCTKGDVNGDNDVTAADAQMAFEIALGRISPTTEQSCASEVTEDDDITAADAQLIFEVALGKSTFSNISAKITNYQSNSRIYQTTNIIVESVEVSENSEIVVPIRIVPGKNITSLTFDIIYDNQELNFKRIDKSGTLLEDFLLADANENDKGKVRLAAAAVTSEPINSEGVLVNLVFGMNAEDFEYSEILLESLKDDISDAQVINGEVILNVETNIWEWFEY